MTEVELVPDLCNCIETVAKARYQEIVQGLMSSGEMGDTAKASMEVLRLFLVGADFRRLRAESEAYLLQGKRVTFVIRAQHRKVEYEIHTSTPR
jgi:hypothetical protein